MDGVPNIGTTTITDPVRSGSSTVHRALELITVLGDAPPEGIHVTEIARRIGANRSTAYRIIDALKHYDFVRSGELPGTIRLGFGLVDLAESVLDRLDIRRVASPHLRALGAQTDETCHLAVMQGSEVVYIDKVQSSQQIQIASRPGKRMPLHSTALGKAFLAAVPPTERADLLNSIRFTQQTPNTITERDSLEADLDHVSQRGWATDLEENSIGIQCVGAAIYGYNGYPVAAISISAPAHRVAGGTLASYGELVLRTAHTISADLGYAR